MKLNRWKGTMVLAAAALSFVTGGCGGSGLAGTYSSTSGTMLVELRSGGKAAFTMMGGTEDCTYTTSGQNLHLTCGNDGVDFRIMDDGSLTSATPFVAATYGVLRKTK